MVAYIWVIAYWVVAHGGMNSSNMHLCTKRYCWRRVGGTVWAASHSLAPAPLPRGRGGCSLWQHSALTRALRLLCPPVPIVVAARATGGHMHILKGHKVAAPAGVKVMGGGGSEKGW